ncbi:MAG: hypothetical protein SNJ84_05590 [Verrucomicrobiia bacterium]
MKPFVFIVPLRARARCRNWTLTSALCVRAVSSMLAVEEEGVRVILVCNERPEGLANDERLRVIEEDFPVPEPSGKAPLEDKFRKIHRGLVEAKPLMPGYLMLADADDCISNRLCPWILSRSEPGNWRLSRGYLHDEGSSTVLVHPEFHLQCGTSHVAWCQAEDLPDDAGSGMGSCFWLRFGHHIIDEEMARLGRPFQDVPFPGAVYVVGHPDNYTAFRLSDWSGWRQKIFRWTRTRPLTASLRREFNLYRLKSLE